MGTYCELYLGEYQLDISKSYIDPFWGCIFKERDRISRKVPFSRYYTQSSVGDELVATTEYCSSVAVVKKRLEILGYTIDRTKEKYVSGLLEKIAENERDYDEFQSQYFVRDLKFLNRLLLEGFDGWVSIAKEIMFERKINSWEIEPGDDAKEIDICTWVLDYTEDNLFYFPVESYGYYLRAVLEAADENDDLVLDVTSLISSGYYERQEAICENTARVHINSTVDFEKVILLTEGSSDSAILSQSLQLLYPDLADYFSLMDFAPTKPEGGTSALEKTVRSFAAAGINNKIIAIFDNDAAGYSAIQRLNSVPLPPNIKIISLPQLPLGVKYPTVGPQGNTLEDINGRACSIELYLGMDVLFEDDKLLPVVWKGFEHKVSAYQGEIGEKELVQKRFYDKLKTARKSGINDSDDWDGLKLIFESIFVTLGMM